MRFDPRKVATAVACIFAILGLMGLVIAYASATRESFVGVKDGRFVHDGKPFHVAGVNNHYLTFGSADEVTRVLDDAVAMRANVVRTFLQPVIGSPDHTTVPTIWNWKSEADASNLGAGGVHMLYWDTERGQMAVNEGANGIARLDFLVAEARKRDLKLMIAFLDFWAYTGGAQQMRAWYGSSDKNTFFFADPRTKQNYKDWVSYVLNRVNPVSGVRYKDDPTIFAWELMNEPDIRPPALRDSWLAEMAAHVKSIAPNQLLTTGRANVSDRLGDIAIPGIDFSGWHGYPLYYKLTPAQFDALIGEFCAIGQAHGKPIVLAEFGLARSHRDQAAVYRTWLDTMHRHAGCAGWLVWRLVSHQDHGGLPEDHHDQFDVYNDGSEVWTVLKDAAEKLRARP